MRVAFVLEGDTDRIAIPPLCAHVRADIEPIPEKYRIESHAKPELIKPVLTALQYRGDDIDAAVVVVDSDATPPHRPEHDLDPDDGCRLCALKEVARSTIASAAKPGYRKLQVAVGMAVPCLEAWLLQDHNVTEVAYINDFERRSKHAYRMELKNQFYGPGNLTLGRRAPIIQAKLADIATLVPFLEREFPSGFGQMAAQIRSWTVP